MTESDGAFVAVKSSAWLSVPRFSKACSRANFELESPEKAQKRYVSFRSPSRAANTVSEIIARIRTVATSIPDLSPELQASAIASYQAGLRAVFIFNAGLALLCFLCTLPLAEFALPDTFEGEDEARRQRVGEREREE